MCYRPITIPNPKLVRGLYDNVMITVPCGQCSECQRAKHTDAYIKLYYEWQDALKQGGFAFFLTLTYNPSHLPRTRFGVPCFNRCDVSNYIKRLRKSLPHATIRYWYCGELGGITRRPHYHIVFFVSGCPFFHFKCRAVAAWRKVLVSNPNHPNKVYEDYGYTAEGKYNYGCVNSAAGLRYVAKYLTKSDNLVKYLNSQYAAIDCNIGNRCSRSIARCKLRDTLRTTIKKRLSPFFLSSEHFGSSLLTSNSVDHIYHNRCLAPDSHGVHKFYKIPLSVQRLIFFNRLKNVHGSESYHLNDLGLQMRQNTFQDAFSAFQFRLSSVYGYPFSPSLLNSINYKFDTHFQSFEELYNYIDLRSISAQRSYFIYMSCLQSSTQCNTDYDLSIPLDVDLYLTKYELTSSILTPPAKSFARFQFIYNNLSEKKRLHFNKISKILSYLCTKISDYLDTQQRASLNCSDYYHPL